MSDQGPIERRPGPPPDEQKNFLLDVAAGYVGGGLWTGTQAALGHLRPAAPPPEVPPSGGGEVPAGTDTPPEWNWPSKD
jgi:hypothetical protein